MDIKNWYANADEDIIPKYISYCFQDGKYTRHDYTVKQLQ